MTSATDAIAAAMNVWVAIRSSEGMGASKKKACGAIRNEVEEKNNPFVHMDKNKISRPCGAS